MTPEIKEIQPGKATVAYWLSLTLVSALILGPQVGARAITPEPVDQISDSISGFTARSILAPITGIDPDKPFISGL